MQPFQTETRRRMHGYHGRWVRAIRPIRDSSRFQRPELTHSSLGFAGKDNPNRYVIATQSLALRKSLRAVPGLPLVYINRSVMLLESPSDQTMQKKSRVCAAG